MNKGILIRNLAELVKVKTLVTFAVICVFCILSLKGKIKPDNVMIITTTVVAFYFGTQLEKKDKEKGANTDTESESEN